MMFDEFFGPNSSKPIRIKLCIPNFGITIGHANLIDGNWYVYFDEHVYDPILKLEGGVYQNINDAKRELLDGYLLFLKSETEKANFAKSKLNQE